MTSSPSSNGNTTNLPAVSQSMPTVAESVDVSGQPLQVKGNVPKYSHLAYRAMVYLSHLCFEPIKWCVQQGIETAKKENMQGIQGGAVISSSESSVIKGAKITGAALLATAQLPLTAASAAMHFSVCGSKNQAQMFDADEEKEAPKASKEEKIEIYCRNLGCIPFGVWAINGLACNTERAEFVADRINTYPSTVFADKKPSIICFQEVFDPEADNCLRKKLNQPEQYRYWASDIGTNRMTLNSGLVIASRFPIESLQFFPYRGTRVIDEKIAQKGFVIAKIKLDTDRVMYIVNTHMQGNDQHTTDALTQYQDSSRQRRQVQLDTIFFELQKFKQATLQPEEQVEAEVVCGDFNFEMVSGRYDNNPYVVLKEVFQATGKKITLEQLQEINPHEKWGWVHINVPELAHQLFSLKSSYATEEDYLKALNQSFENKFSIHFMKEDMQSEKKMAEHLFLQLTGMHQHLMEYLQVDTTRSVDSTTLIDDRIDLQVDIQNEIVPLLMRRSEEDLERVEEKSVLFRHFTDFSYPLARRNVYRICGTDHAGVDDRASRILLGMSLQTIRRDHIMGSSEAWIEVKNGAGETKILKIGQLRGQKKIDYFLVSNLTAALSEVSTGIDDSGGRMTDHAGTFAEIGKKQEVSQGPRHINQLGHSQLFGLRAKL